MNTNDCPIFIPTYKRIDKQITLKNLPQQFKERHVVLVVREEEYEKHKLRYGNQVLEVACLPSGIQNRAQTVKYLVEKSLQNYAFFMDDDLVFHFRPNVEDYHLKLMETHSIFEKMFEDLLAKAETENLAHVAVSMRGGNNHHMDEWVYNTRYMRACIYNLEILKKENIILDRCPLMEDFDTELQLLRKGYPCAINHQYAQGEVAFCAPGGAFDQRIQANHGQTPAELLKSFHPDFVTVIQKKTKAYKWNGGTRTDVRVQWDKAYKSSQIHMAHLAGKKVVQKEIEL